MQTDNPFDKKLEALRGHVPTHLENAMVEATDTLDFAWAAVQAVFGDKAEPEHAISLLPHFLVRADAIRQRTADEYRKKMEGA